MLMIEPRLNADEELLDVMLKTDLDFSAKIICLSACDAFRDMVNLVLTETKTSAEALVGKSLTLTMKFRAPTAEELSDPESVLLGGA